MRADVNVPKRFSLVQEGGDVLILKGKYKCPGLQKIVSEFSPGVKGAHGNFYGRASYVAMPVSELGGRRVIVRRYSHGGLWGRLAGDILWGQGRPLRELINAERAMESGVDTAEVVALRFRKYLGPLYKADIFTLEIPGTEDLMALLSRHPSSEEFLQKRELIRHIARAVRKMHDAGLLHADLHLKNILVRKDELPRVYIIDLDKSSFYEEEGGGLSMGQRMDNLLRLDRSVEKFCRWRPDLRCITRIDRLRFLREYALGMGEDWRVLVRKYAGRHVAHGLWWRFLDTAGFGLYNFERRRGRR